MKVRILQKFHDRVDYMKVYLVGETVTFDDARAESLIRRGLVESAEEPIELEAETEAEAADALEAEDVAAEVKEEPIEQDETPVEEAAPKAVKPVATKRKSKNE